MARYVGTNGRVEVDGQVVAEVRSFEVNINRDPVQAPAMGRDWVGQDIGPDTVSGTISCWSDPADTAGQGALRVRSAVALILQKQGVGAGLPQVSIPIARISAITDSDESGEYGETEFSFVADSQVDETPQV